MQCGFCTPGMIMSCAALVERKSDCSLDDVKAAIAGHLCRCGTYPNIFAATLAAADVMRSRPAGDRQAASSSNQSQAPSNLRAEVQR
jgi:xanthine dehydrogenase iron-sulfur cluster and FAD-binding subunit A